MLRKKSKFLIFTVVIAAVAMFSVTEAGAVICQVDGEQFPLEADSNGEYFCPEGLEALGCCDNMQDPVTQSNWVVEVGTVKFPNTNERPCVDKKGNEIASTNFTYLIHLPNGDSVSLPQFNVSMPATCPGADISKVCPFDQSVKIVPYETVTGWPNNETLKIASWNSIKFDPSNKGEASIATTDATANTGGIELITGNGPIYGTILTPACCGTTPVASNKEFIPPPRIAVYDFVPPDTTAKGIVEPAEGGDFVANTAASGDDIQLVDVGQLVEPGETIIDPGADNILQTSPTYDDVVGDVTVTGIRAHYFCLAASDQDVKLDVNYSQCTGEFESITVKDDSGETPLSDAHKRAIIRGIGTLSVPPDLRDTTPVDEMGPSSGGIILTRVEASSTPTTVHTIINFGYGQSIYEAPIELEYTSCNPPPACDPNNPSYVIGFDENTITFDGKYFAEYDNCGNVINAINLTTGDPADLIGFVDHDGDPSTPQVAIDEAMWWGARGLDDNVRKSIFGRVIGGGPKGGALYVNGCMRIGGNDYCW